MGGGSDFWARWQPEPSFGGIPKVYEQAMVLRPKKFQTADRCLGAPSSSKLLRGQGNKKGS